MQRQRRRKGRLTATILASLLIAFLGAGSGPTRVYAAQDSALLCVSNEANVPAIEVGKVVAAVQQQLDLDVQTYWQKTAQMYATCDGHSGAWKIRLVETDDTIAGAYGYHYNLDDKTPYAVIIMSELRKHHRPWSVTFSHEILEMLIDPYPRFDVYTVDDGTYVYAVEISDPCHNRTYRINDVEVSDFATPAWFTVGAKGPYDFLQYLYKPFVVDEDGGYIPIVGRVDDGGSQPRRIGPD